MFIGREEFVKALKKYKRNLLFICIGTTDYVWDSFGPWLGDAIKELHSIRVIGTSDDEINSENITKIKKYFKRKSVFYVDASTDKKDNIGIIEFKTDGSLMTFSSESEEIIFLEGKTIRLITTDDPEGANILSEYKIREAINEIITEIKDVLNL